MKILDTWQLRQTKRLAGRDEAEREDIQSCDLIDCLYYVLYPTLKFYHQEEPEDHPQQCE